MERISKDSLDKIARRVEAVERAKAANAKAQDWANFARHENYLNGMDFVLCEFGYVVQYKTNTEVEIKPLDEVRHG